MTRFLVLLAALMLLSWMVQRSLRSLAGRAAQHPLAQLLRLLLGGPPQPASRGGAASPAPGRQLVRCGRCGVHVPPDRLGSSGGETFCDECKDE